MDPTQANKDPALWHHLLRERWPLLQTALAAKGLIVEAQEGYRPDERQQWLYAQGRTRPGPIVTNASSAKLSAHGYTIKTTTWGGLPVELPAACALDVVPLGPDGRPWTKDDPWETFVALTTDPGSLGYSIGLVHFHRPGIAVWDKPHLQLIEWSDAKHTLLV